MTPGFIAAAVGRVAGRILGSPRLDLSGPDSLYLDVNGRKFPLARLNASWDLNGVPRAVVELVAGQTADGRVSVAHSALPRDWGPDPKATVYLKLAGDLGGRRPPPAAPQPVFEGRLVGGIRVTRMADRLAVTATLTHWLGDLSAGSVAAGGASVRNPADLSTRLMVKTSTGEMVSSYARMGESPGVRLALRSDLWDGLHKHLSFLASRPPGYQLEGVQVAIAADSPRARAALARFEAGRYTYARPTATGDDFRASDGVMQAVGDFVGFESMSVLAAVTYWDLLVGRYAPGFGLDVVPLAGSALVAAASPYRPAAAAWRTVWPDWYYSSSYDPAPGLPPRTVFVPSTAPMASGGNPGWMFSAGQFDPTRPPAGPEAGVPAAWVEGGLVLAVQGPPWLERIARQALAGGEGPAAQQAAAAAHARLVSAWARDTYLREALRGRTGTLAGPLRFDVAPGSLLLVKGRPEPAVGDAPDGLAPDRLATVARVSVAIWAGTNTTPGQAGTAFDLVGVRTAAEEGADARYTWTGHPVLGPEAALWKGAPLVPAFDIGQ